MNETTGTGVGELAVSSASGGLRQALWIRLHDADFQRLLINVSVILIIGLFVQTQTGRFFIPRNLESLSIEIAVMTICAAAETLVMVAGQIDVSIAGVVAMTGVVAGMLITGGVPMWLAFLLATLVGMGVGVVNGILVIGVRIPAFIATVGTLFVAQGAASLFTNGLTIVGVPQDFGVIGSGYIGGEIPFALPIILITVSILVAIQRYTVFGRHVVAVGSNLPAAYLNGVNVNWTLMRCFMISGLVAGWGGVMYASRLGNPTPVVDSLLLFQCIVAVVVGGTSMTGGQGSVLGTFVGCILIGVLNNALNLLGVSTFYQYLALGVLLVASVASGELLRPQTMQQIRQFASRLRRLRPGRAG